MVFVFIYVAEADRLVLEVKGVLSVEEARKESGWTPLTCLASPPLNVCCKSATARLVILSAYRGLISSGPMYLSYLFVLFFPRFSRRYTNYSSF